jgi:hypothetical protein
MSYSANRYLDRIVASLGSPLQTLEDRFVPQPLTDRSVAVAHDDITRWNDVAYRVGRLAAEHQLHPVVLAWGEEHLVATFGERTHAALFKLFWID